MENNREQIQKHNLQRIQHISDSFEKGGLHKYFKREGVPGNYKYYYTEKEYKEVKGKKVEGEKKKEESKKEEKKHTLKVGIEVQLNQKLVDKYNEIPYKYGLSKKDVFKVEKLKGLNKVKIKSSKFGDLVVDVDDLLPAKLNIKLEKAFDTLGVDYFEKGKYIKMDLDELVGEHKKLIKILKNTKDKKAIKEAEKQKKELEGYIKQKEKVS